MVSVGSGPAGTSDGPHWTHSSAFLLLTPSLSEHFEPGDRLTVQPPKRATSRASSPFPWRQTVNLEELLGRNGSKGGGE
jgi:hypothetical protein